MSVTQVAVLRFDLLAETFLIFRRIGVLYGHQGRPRVANTRALEVPATELRSVSSLNLLVVSDYFDLEN